MAMIVVGWRIIQGPHPNVPVPYILGLVIDALLLIGWFALPSPERLRVTAEHDAHQLLQGAVMVSETQPAAIAQAARRGAAVAASWSTLALDVASLAAWLASRTRSLPSPTYTMIPSRPRIRYSPFVAPPRRSSRA